MDEITQFLSQANAWLTPIVEIGTTLIVLYKWLIKPQREMMALIKKQDEAIGDILCDRLQQAHDYYVNKAGWCSASDKQRLIEMHKRYRGQGRNHLADHNEQDILSLPENPRYNDSTGAME